MSTSFMVIYIQSNSGDIIIYRTYNNNKNNNSDRQRVGSFVIPNFIRIVGIHILILVIIVFTGVYSIAVVSLTSEN